MKLEEAIEIITKEAKGYHPDFSKRTIAALNLGAEGLKAILLQRKVPAFDYISSLPSETKE